MTISTPHGIPIRRRRGYCPQERPVKRYERHHFAQRSTTGEQDEVAGAVTQGRVPLPLKPPPPGP
jgi:hypothetical protein